MTLSLQIHSIPILPPAHVIQGHIASIKEMECIIAMYDQDGDSEFNLVSFDLSLGLSLGLICKASWYQQENSGICLGGGARVRQAESEESPTVLDNSLGA
jgi:hypothetical protein